MGDQAGASLYLAAKKGDAQRVRALFVAGADLHAKPVRFAGAGIRRRCALRRSAVREARGARRAEQRPRPSDALIPPLAARRTR